MATSPQLPPDFVANEAALPEALKAAADALGVELPADYCAFLLTTNGGEGFIGDNYVVLWRAEELATFNAELEVSDFAPGLTIFGGDGGGELFGFDGRSATMAVVVVPAVGMSLSAARLVAPTFAEFLSVLAATGLWDLW